MEKTSFGRLDTTAVVNDWTSSTHKLLKMLLLILVASKYKIFQQHNYVYMMGTHPLNHFQRLWI